PPSSRCVLPSIAVSSSVIGSPRARSIAPDGPAADLAPLLGLAAVLDVELLVLALHDRALVARAGVVVFLLAGVARRGDRVVALDLEALLLRAGDAAGLRALAQARLDELAGAACERRLLVGAARIVFLFPTGVADVGHAVVTG